MSPFWISYFIPATKMTGQDATPYRGHNFLTISEARWAVFFDALKRTWYYDPGSEWVTANPQHYRPQFSLPDLNAYLEVRHPSDHRDRQPQRHRYPEIEEPVSYLAVGDLPDERQLGSAGWWDSGRNQGVKLLTPGDEWGSWFPPDYPDVLQALEAARTTEFESAIPFGRQPSKEVGDIPEREREQRLE